MKRLTILSSDSDSDDLDISKIKDKYMRPKKKLKKEIIDKATKGAKSDPNQMSILAAFNNVSSTKRKSENFIDTFFKKVSKVEKNIITPEDFFSVKKNNTKENVNVVEDMTNNVMRPFVVETSPMKTPVKSSENIFSGNSSPMSASKKIGYINYLQREGPKALGSKEIPDGSPNCLIGSTFVITGVLDSIEREDAQSLIERCGGRVTGAVSSRTTYIIVGLQPGESKIQKANQFKIKQINEDGLFELIRDRTSKLPQNWMPTPTEEDAQKLPQPSVTNMPDPTILKTTTLSPISNNIGPVSLKITPNPPENLSSNPIIVNTESHKNTPSLLFVDKYRPMTLKKIVGQHGPQSVANKLLTWLKNFDANLKSNSKSEDDGSRFRAALLSGPPGIGKTTTAQLVCKELGYYYVELNASIVRSKNNLKTDMSNGLSTYFNIDQKDVKHCYIMDEVDGMSGNEDRGGINELIQIIKTTKCPIICICNDRQSRKLQSFVKHVYDLRYRQLTPEQVKATMLSVAFKEKFKLPDDAINCIIQASNYDMRQVLNNLQMWSAGSLQSEVLKNDAKNACKEFKRSPFDIVKRVFSHEELKTYSDKSELFFQDYQLNGLFVQENYPHVRPTLARDNMSKTMRLMSLAADSIATGDIVSSRITKTNNWSLLPTQAMFSSVIPGEYLKGSLSARVDFPSWLGKFSRANKNSRILSSLCSHLSLSTRCGVVNSSTLSMDYGDLLIKKLVTPLREGDIETVLLRLQQTRLLKDDMDMLIEATVWPHLANPLAGVSAQIKATLTRAYNKSTFLLPHADINAKKSTKISAPIIDTEEGAEEDLEEEEEAKQDDVESDAMIVKRKAPKKLTGNVEEKVTKSKKTAPKKVAEPKAPKEKKVPAKREKKPK